MITREADYAIRTVLFLSQNHGKGAVSTTEISKKMDIPYRFLRKISHHLVESGIAGALRGKQGGIFLQTSPDKISLLDILQLFDERAITVNLCCKSDKACDRSNKCPVHTRLEALQETLQKEFADVKFSELI